MRVLTVLMMAIHQASRKRHNDQSSIHQTSRKRHNDQSSIHLASKNALSYAGSGSVPVPGSIPGSRAQSGHPANPPNNVSCVQDLDLDLGSDCML